MKYYIIIYKFIKKLTINSLLIYLGVARLVCLSPRASGRHRPAAGAFRRCGGVGFFDAAAHSRKQRSRDKRPCKYRIHWLISLDKGFVFILHNAAAPLRSKTPGRRRIATRDLPCYTWGACRFGVAVQMRLVIAYRRFCADPVRKRAARCGGESLAAGSGLSFRPAPDEQRKPGAHRASRGHIKSRRHRTHGGHPLDKK